MTERDLILSVDGRSLVVDYVVESWGYPSNGWDDAGEGPEFSVMRATVESTGEAVPLDEALVERLEAMILDEPGALDPPEYDD